MSSYKGHSIFAFILSLMFFHNPLAIALTLIGANIPDFDHKFKKEHVYSVHFTLYPQITLLYRIDHYIFRGNFLFFRTPKLHTFHFRRFDINCCRFTNIDMGIPAGLYSDSHRQSVFAYGNFNCPFKLFILEQEVAHDFSSIIFYRPVCTSRRWNFLH